MAMLRSLLALLVLPLAVVASGQWSDSAIKFSILPNTTGFTELMKRREKQIWQMKDSQERWDATTTMLMTCCMLPSFTKNGFKVIKQPKGVHDRLLKALKDGIKRSEGATDQIKGGANPDFVGIGGLGREIMEELRPLHEEWASIPPGGLRSSNAYGLRIYKPGNTLTMHTDHSETHVISSILHVDRDSDVPWPIVIEGFDGKTYEVDLQPGEMLLYESAKCHHGRPRAFEGNWYTSLFIHYKPVSGWNYNVGRARDLIDEANRAGGYPPGGWGRDALPQDGSVPELRMRGTGMYEPDCAATSSEIAPWCNLSPVWPLKTGNVYASEAPTSKETTHQEL